MIRRVLAVGGLLLPLIATACSGSSSTQRVTMTAHPDSGLLDSSVAVSISGLTPAAHVTVSASARDAGGTTWRSSARFVASKAGTLTLADASTGGSYVGSYPMGLFDLMAPPRPDAARTPYFASLVAGYAVTLKALVKGHVVASTTVRRESGRDTIVSRQLRPAADGVYGELDTPRHLTGRKPAVLLFGGSEGGLDTSFGAERLAADGYAALALAYFDAPGLPTTLTNIPLEYFVTALKILRRQPDVDPDHVFVFGDSRGSEAALLLGSDFPDLVNGVIAGVPSSVANIGYPEGAVAWTLHGRAVPTAPIGQYPNPSPPDTAAIIRVERIRGPVLTVCAGQDQVWPSCPYAAAITARLQAHHFRYPLIALRYPGAGHVAGAMACCYSTTASAVAPYGGTLVDDQMAKRAAWNRMLTLLASY